jgi:hypothetical protein
VGGQRHPRVVLLLKLSVPKGKDYWSSEEFRCVPCHPWWTHRTSLVVKKKLFFSFPVAVNNSIKVGPLVSSLQMFVITENIMERPVLDLLNYINPLTPELDPSTQRCLTSFFFAGDFAS